MVHIDVWKWISHPPEVYRSMFQLPWISVLKKQSTVTQCHWIIAVHCHVKHVVFKATWGILRYKNGWRLRLKFMHFNVLDLYRLLIIDESGLPWLLNFTPLLRHVEVEHQAHQGTLQHFFLCYLNWIHLRVSWQGPSKGSDQTCMWGLFCHHNKLTNLWNAAINHVNDLEKARLFMKHYKDQPSIVNFIVGFQVMESLEVGRRRRLGAGKGPTFENNMLGDCSHVQIEFWLRHNNTCSRECQIGFCVHVVSESWQRHLKKHLCRCPVEKGKDPFCTLKLAGF